MKASKKLTVLKGGKPIDLDAYLAGLSSGFRYSFKNTDRFFQEDYGVTAAGSIGAPIGLALDQRSWLGLSIVQVLATQPDKVVGARPFAGVPAQVTNVGGTFGMNGNAIRLSIPADTTSARMEIDFTGVVGRFYKIAYSGNTNFGLSAAAWLNLSLANPGVNGSTTPNVEYIVQATGTACKIRLYPRSSSAVAASQKAGDFIEFTEISIKELPGFHASQSNGTFKPTRQAQGAKGDGSDDNLLSTYLASAGNNFLMAKTTVPVSLAATQLLAGASGSGANRFFLGINTSGQACAGIGSDSTGTIVGTSDLRGLEANIAVTCNATTVRLIVNDIVEYEAAQNSTPTTTIPFRAFAYNNNGTAASYYAGYIAELLAGTDYLDAAKFNLIRRSY